jgi:hypothetical protein
MAEAMDDRRKADEEAKREARRKGGRSWRRSGRPRSAGRPRSEGWRRKKAYGGKTLRKVPSWGGERFNVWTSPRCYYLFAMGGGTEAPVAMDDMHTYALKQDDDSIVLMLMVCKARWPGQTIELFGDDRFKARARELAEERGLGMEFTPEPAPEMMPERDQRMGR